MPGNSRQERKGGQKSDGRKPGCSVSLQRWAEVRRRAEGREQTRRWQPPDQVIPSTKAGGGGWQETESERSSAPLRKITFLVNGGKPHKNQCREISEDVWQSSQGKHERDECGGRASQRGNIKSHLKRKTATLVRNGMWSLRKGEDVGESQLPGLAYPERLQRLPEGRRKLTFIEPPSRGQFLF